MEQEQGWHSDENACLPTVCLGFDFLTRCDMWVKSVVGSVLASRGFTLGSPVSLPLQSHRRVIPIVNRFFL